MHFFRGFQILCGSHFANPLATSPPVRIYNPPQPYSQIVTVINKKLNLITKKREVRVYVIYGRRHKIRKIYINLENHCEYPHKPEPRVNGLHLCHYSISLIFIQIFVVGSEKRTSFERQCVMSLRGHPRSCFLAPIESAYATSYWSSIVTLVYLAPFKRYCRLTAENDPPLFHPNFRGVPFGLDCRCCGS